MAYMTDAGNVILHKRPGEMHKRGYEIGKMTACGPSAYSK